MLGDRRPLGRLRLARRRRDRGHGRGRRRGEVIALSYGERGESGELWKEEDQTIENVKEIRHAEAERAAAALGAEFECLDLGDYPLEIDADALRLIAERIREFAPDVLITHTDTDPFNPDHPVAFAAVIARAQPGRRRAACRARSGPSARRSCSCSSPISRSSATSRRPRSWTSRAVMEKKLAAMAEMKAQSYLQTLLRRARRPPRQPRAAVVGNATIRQAEAFQRVIPQVVSAL